MTASHFLSVPKREWLDFVLPLKYCNNKHIDSWLKITLKNSNGKLRSTAIQVRIFVRRHILPYISFQGDLAIFQADRLHQYGTEGHDQPLVWIKNSVLSLISIGL
jgi:hypothetical protein